MCIAAVCRWIESSVGAALTQADAHGAHGYPAIAIALLVLLAAARLNRQFARPASGDDEGTRAGRRRLPY